MKRVTEEAKERYAAEVAATVKALLVANLRHSAADYKDRAEVEPGEEKSAFLAARGRSFVAAADFLTVFW